VRLEREGLESKGYLDCAIHLAQLFLRKIANASSKASLIHSVEVAQVDDGWAGKAGFRGRNAHAHRELSHAGVARDGRDDGQLARLVADIVLHDQGRMQTRIYPILVAGSSMK